MKALDAAVHPADRRRRDRHSPLESRIVGVMRRDPEIKTAVGSLLALLVTCSCRSSDPTSAPSPPASIEPVPAPVGFAAPSDAKGIEAVAMAKTLRVYYPVLRAADDAADAATTCVGGNPREKVAKAKKCVAPLAESLTNGLGRLPGDARKQGCSRVVEQAVQAALADLKQRVDAAGTWDTGIEFGAFHEATKSCAAMFRCGALDKPEEACTPAQLEGHLGLRDDAEPSPSTFAADRPGHLWLADGREVKRETLDVSTR